MTISLWIQLATFVATLIAACFILVRYINSADSTVIKDTDTKIGRVYGRLDEEKRYRDDCFVRKDMCKVLHEQTAFNLTASETRSNDRFDKLEKKVDQILSILLKNNI
jgi:hypothetical protein